MAGRKIILAGGKIILSQIYQVFFFYSFHEAKVENEGELSSLAKSGGGKRNSGKGAPRPSLLTSLSQSLLDDSLEFAKRFNADINFVHAKFAARKPLGLREGVKKNVDENEISPKWGGLGGLNPKQGPNP